MPKKIHRRRDTSPEEGLMKYGETQFADPVNKQYPINTPGRLKAAWAYIHQPSNAAKYSAAEARTIKSRIRREAKRLFKQRATEGSAGTARFRVSFAHREFFS